MDVFEAIGKRHSYRGGFTEKSVSRQDLEAIVQAGLQAPSGCNAQTTSFVIVDDPGLRKSIADVVDNQVVHEAQAIIVCVADHRTVYRDMSFGVEDCSAAVENILLAITALGYATVWIDGALRSEDRAERIGALLGVPKDREVRIILPVGEPKEHWDQKEKLPFEERAWFNAWQGGEREDDR